MRSGLLLVLSIVSAFLFAAETHAQTTRLHGKVLDSRTGEPIAKATVSIRERKVETRTADNGEFELADVEAGRIELYVQKR